MVSATRTLLEALAVIGTLCCLSFYLLSVCSLLKFLNDNRRSSRVAAASLPPVSILKPLKGADPEMFLSFASHAEQNYPAFEIIFGVSDPQDPACETVRQLQAKYPACQIKLVVCERILGTNVKVSNLAQMLPHASHEILLVNDSDIRVAPDYLRQVVSPLIDSQNTDSPNTDSQSKDSQSKDSRRAAPRVADPEVGLVTCLYRAVPAATLGSRLEALTIATDFAPGVLSARFLEKGLHFGLGSTLVFRRSHLRSIGGFESILDYLADDYELGRRLAATGKRVELSRTVVETFLPAYSLRGFWQHQLRWSRTIRDARRSGYLGLIFTFGLPWSIAMLIAANGAVWSWALFAITIAARLIVALGTGLGVLEDRSTLRNIILLPLRDLLAPVIWAAGLFGNRIHWRGDDFYLKDGRLSKVPSAR